jgi:L-asparaginase / beta-aspartyl-peptidase
MMKSPKFNALMFASLASLAFTALPANAMASDKKCKAQKEFSIILHGGTARAGMIPEQRLDFMRNLLVEMKQNLKQGDSALNVVEASIMAMENSGLFNAGKGAINNAAGFVETDASIMDGKTQNAGSVASMRLVKNPIRAARLVMDETRHVMMVGDRGEQAVTDIGAETVKAEYFINNHEDEPDNHGTVGAAVLDRCGNLAAGTSTGGYDAKIPGRVGDSPVIGAGTFAKNNVVAASATGHGEYFIRFNATASIAARMEYGGADVASATKAVIDQMAKAGGEKDGRGGLIAVDAQGNFAYPFSTPGMVRGIARYDIDPQVGVFEDMN